jgi:hypothetical protein
VAVSKFFLVVTLTGSDLSAAMVRDVATSTLQRIGYPPGTVFEIVGALAAALPRQVDEVLPGCEVQFRADVGSLRIVVSVDDAPTWRLTRPLPSAD